MGWGWFRAELANGDVDDDYDVDGPATLCPSVYRRLVQHQRIFINAPKMDFNSHPVYIV